MPTFIDEKIQGFEYEVKEGETYSLRLASFRQFPNVSICIKVQNNGTFDGAFADFSRDSGTFNLTIELLGDGAKATWHYAGLCDEESRKIVDTSVDHLSPRSKAEVSQYGIAKDHGQLTFVGTSHIHNGMKGSATAQKEKIIVFDKGAVGKCSPILKIDENDVAASHSAIVGKLSDEHLFYLLSRGIELENAKRLMTLGYIRPIVEYFGQDTAQEILNHLEAGL